MPASAFVCTALTRKQYQTAGLHGRLHSYTHMGRKAPFSDLTSTLFQQSRRHKAMEEKKKYRKLQSP